MLLERMSFAALKPTWLDARTVSRAWFPAFDGSLDSWLLQARGAELLSVLVLDVLREPYRLRHMGEIRARIVAELEVEGAVLDHLAGDSMDEIRKIATQCRSVRGCLFGDPVPYLALNITNERSVAVVARWDSEGLNVS